MEDQDKIQAEEEEVEAHKRHGHKPAASVDAPTKDEGEDEGDFELHKRHGHKPA